jgi:hypothetical protein
MSLLTTDIYEGAYLLSRGLKLDKLWIRKNSSLRGNARRSVVFEFAGIDADILRKDYRNGYASANVTKLKQALNELKDRMFDLMRSQEENKNYESKQSCFQV